MNNSRNAAIKYASLVFQGQSKIHENAAALDFQAGAAWQKDAVMSVIESPEFLINLYGVARNNSLEDFKNYTVKEFKNYLENKEKP